MLSWSAVNRTGPIIRITSRVLRVGVFLLPERISPFAPA